MHPIFYIINYTVTVNRMKTTTLPQLIAEIAALKPIEERVEPIQQLLALIERTEESWEQRRGWEEVVGMQSRKMGEVVGKYNWLLEKVGIMIELNYQILQETQTEFDELNWELQKSKKENQQRISELQSLLQQNSKTVQLLRNALLQKHEELSFLHDQTQLQEIELQDMSHKNIQLQTLKNHKRQRSHLCTSLEKQNLILTLHNAQIKEENIQLLSHVAQLSEHIQRMEQDMALANIKSPQLIPQNAKGRRASEGFSNTFNSNYNDNQNQNQIDKNSLGDGGEGELIFANTFSQGMMSASSSFLQRGRPLRDMLNISGQSSTYFNFRTRERFKESNCKQVGQYSNENIDNENNQNDINCMNVASKQRKYGNNIMQIKEFEANEQSVNKTVSDSQPKGTDCEDKGCIQLSPPPKVQMPSSPPIDPYHAYFLLTIQCLKLNWKDMNEVANVNIKDEWPQLIEKGIPIHKWSEHLKQLLAAKIKGQRPY